MACAGDDPPHSTFGKSDKLDGMIIDAHCHILPPSFAQRRGELVSRDATFASLFPQPGAKMTSADDAVQAMDRAGVDRSIVMGMGWTGMTWPGKRMTTSSTPWAAIPSGLWGSAPSTRHGTTAE